MCARVAFAFAVLAGSVSTLSAALPANLWDADIRRFEMLDREQPTPDGGVVFVGSSSIRLWDLKKSFPKLDAINRGFGGSELTDSVRHIDRLVLHHKPRLIVLYAGDNDLARGKTPEQIASDFDAFQTTVHAALPETRILYIGIKPSIARWQIADGMQETNRRIESMCRASKNCEFIDVWGPMLGENDLPNRDLFVWDGLHMNEAGYAIWTKLIEDRMRPAVVSR